MKRLWYILFVLFASLIAKSGKAEAWVDGSVFEQDGSTPIEGASVCFSGVNTEGDTVVFVFLSDSIGYYEAVVDAGTYLVAASAEGYATSMSSDSLFIEDGDVVEDYDFILHELYLPVNYVAARQYGEDMVRVSWSMNEPRLEEGFETGDFTQFSWSNTLSEHPWVIDSTHAHNGSYCMKSSCEGVDGGYSQIEVSIYVPVSGQMRFFGRISSESPWDMGLFYIDGVKKLECSGQGEWQEHCFPITVGEHLFTWKYQKDALNNAEDDCFYIDDICFCEIDTIAKGNRVFQYYELFRRRFEEEPTLLVSHIIDTAFMDMNWGSLDWGQYAWGVSCYYEGNRGSSDTVWSARLDKDMTIPFELQATTNTGSIPVGAQVMLTSLEVPELAYQASLDGNGWTRIQEIYRGNYSLMVHLEGYENYQLDTISIFDQTFLEIELTESVLGIDSLYVSSTGWAMWQLETRDLRDLQYFELRLGGVLVDTTSQMHYQFDTDGLIDGNHYLVQVRPVFLTETCEWASRDWLYRNCSHFPSAELQWSFGGEAVELSWAYPENDSVMGVVLYRDGLFLGYFEGTSYLDVDSGTHGTMEYCIRYVYNGAHDGHYYSMSCEQCVSVILPAYCDPPVKLEGEKYVDEDGYGALISWGERPEPIEEWLHYDDGEYLNRVGNNGEPMFWSIRFSAEDLIAYQGTSLKKISLFDVGAGSYQLWVYIGGETAPRTLVWFQEMAMDGTYTWKEHDITPALDIPSDEPLWIVIGQQGLSRPAAACADMGNPNGRWTSLNGTDWFDLHHFNMYYTWMLRAFVANRSGRLLSIGDEDFTLESYHLYRSYDNLEYQQIASVPAVEGQLFYQYKDRLVDDSHNDFYYRLTALYLSEEGDECESDYAASLLDPSQNYVLVTDPSSVNDDNEIEVKLYPNPNQGVLSIEALDLCHILVYDANGQRLYEKEVSSNMTLLDLSDFRDGLYLIRIITGDGVATRPFVISR